MVMEDTLMNELAPWNIEDSDGELVGFEAGTVNAMRAAQLVANERGKAIVIRRIRAGIEDRRTIEPIMEKAAPEAGTAMNLPDGNQS